MSARHAAAELAAVSDDQVMASVTAGSAEAFAVLYDRYRDRAWRVAWSVCRDAGRTEEAIQEAFISIWKTRTTYESHRGKVASWVLTITRHRAIDIARRNDPHAAHRAGEASLDTVRAPASVDEEVVARAQASDVLSALAQLPDAQREVITLGFYGQLTHSEIAEHLGLPLGTIKGRMRSGLQRLRGDIQRVAS